MATFDVDAWLGVEVLSIIGKPIVLHSRILDSLKNSAADGTLAEDDVGWALPVVTPSATRRPAEREAKITGP